jgi:hypothetical protein
MVLLLVGPSWYCCWRPGPGPGPGPPGPSLVLPTPLACSRPLRRWVWGGAADGLQPEIYLARQGATLILCFHHLAQVPEGYAHPAAPLRLAGDVTDGFGRGSRQLGVPTANLPPGPLAEQLRGLPSGVYFGQAEPRAGPASSRHR